MEKNKKKPVEADKKVLSFFLIMFPTLLIVILGVLKIEWGGVLMIALAFYQSIMLKQFLDNYYRDSIEESIEE